MRYPSGNSLYRSAAVAVSLAAVGLVSPEPLDGQTRGIALRGGINLATFVGVDAPEGEPKPGLSLGASFQLINIGPVTIAPEVYYAQKGSIQNITAAAMDPTQSTLSQADLEFTLAYVEIPLLAIVHLPFGGKTFGPYLEGGPAFAWNLDCRVDLSGAESIEDTCDELFGENIEATLKDYELGFVVGLGTDIHLFGGMGALNLDARLTQGLSRLSEDSEIANQAFTLMLGYRFGF